MSFKYYLSLDLKEKIKYITRLLSGRQKKSKELEQLIQAQAWDDTDWTHKEIPKIDMPDLPDEEALLYIMRTILKWNTNRIYQAIKRLPKGYKALQKEN